jgi:pyruvate carboxylase
VLINKNRGEIAIRILSSARELGIFTVAVYTTDDPGHATHADDAVVLESPADFMNTKKIVSICQAKSVDALHPGYGFLSENPEIVDLLSQVGITFIGPTADILRETGDKTRARSIAERNGVPVLPASPTAFSSVKEARSFVASVGFPIMIKAVDGGGGRGIRLVERGEDLESSFARACGESPSRSVFVEKAAIHGFRHVEVQILGDNHGNIAHLWERECSIQRRFQKVIELAPSTIKDRSVIANVIKSAVRLARSIRYRSLGTFEFLVHESSGEYYFLEVNPRLQVEHTITEEITGVDIVRSQLLLAQGASVTDLDLPSCNSEGSAVPKAFAMQLRITAEDAKKGFTLSMGRIAKVKLPGGHGVRVDTHLGSLVTTTVGASYDSLLAKVIVRAASFEAARTKAIRALIDVEIKGIQTNVPALLGVLLSDDFIHGHCSTLWLESNLADVLEKGSAISEQVDTLPVRRLDAGQIESGSSPIGMGAAASVLFKKGDGFNITMQEEGSSGSAKKDEYLLKLDRVRINDFPTGVAADITVTSSTSGTKKYAATISMSSQTSVMSAAHRVGDPKDATHVCLPFSGQFAEMDVDEGDVVREGDLLCVIKQMKMELEVRAPYDAVVTWVCEVEDGETVNEGLLACTLRRIETSSQEAKRPEVLAKI